MDPNETLRRIRELRRAIQHEEVVGIDVATDLADAIQDLDEWLSKGGFPPTEWTASGLVLPEGFIAVEKDSCEAESPSHLQCWGSYGHEKDGEEHYTGTERWS